MGRILDSYGNTAYDHEGYPAYVLDDGTLTSTHSNETRPRMIGQVIAACDCGWTGTTRYPCPEPFDAEAEELALTEWEHTHAVPTLERDRAARAHRVQRALADLAECFPAMLTGTAMGQSHRGQLDRALRVLEMARELVTERQEQSVHEEPGT